MSIKSRARLLVGFAITGGAALAVLVPALPAVGDHSPVGDESFVAPVLEVAISDATRAAKGAVAYLSVDMRCSEHAQAVLQVTVTQRSGNGIAQGFGFTEPPDIVCDGDVHTVTMTVTANGKPFMNGVAFATAEAFAAFPPFNQPTTRVQSESVIRIGKSSTKGSSTKG
jgi:hypothetical protein